MTGRLLAIVNPAAGLGRARRAWPRLAVELTAAGVDFDAVVTRTAGEASEVAAAAQARQPRPVLAVGGDGTLNEVLNGLMRAGGRATLAVAPFGTGNDWASFLAVPRAPRALAAMLAQGRTRAVDVGRLEYEAETGRATCHFINVAGAGYDAYVLELRSPRLPAALAYPAALAAGLIRYRAPRFRVQAGDGTIDGPLFVAFAMLGRSCGGGMRFAPDARPDDGLLDLVTVAPLSAPAVLARLPRLYRGRLLGDPAIGWRQCAEVAIDAAPAARVEADGQLLGRTPACARVLAAAIDFVVP